jgi:hypothetical protein
MLLILAQRRVKGCQHRLDVAERLSVHESFP